ncbi:CdaR family protein [Anaerobranca gottschalkii]|uniref:YbbR domain-containing protein n=1 Tax=Anaerobranca gottschalkii DSM 13577 TaxID=1120990 RepID=A0A1I0CM65_9FIRM|nr:CdaR family protein [Anaerobranca gottschalkii]SET20735.1 YbbR domain-containing protein [Anaerobranca gottschalkii DSM 13577]
MKGYGKNLGTKFISIFLGVILWLFVYGQQSPLNTPEFTRTLTNIPVEIIGANRDFQYIVTPSTVDIVIRGSQDVINSLVNREHKATVDVRGLDEGIHNLPVSTSLTGGVVQNIKPNYITVIVDPILTQEFPISLTTEGELPGGLVLKDVLLTPNTITLTGPKGELERVSKVEVVLNLEEIGESGRISVPARALDIYGRNINALQPNISNVIIEVVIEGDLVEGEFSIGYRNLQQGLKVALSPTTVQAKFPKNINKDNIEVFVDLEGLEEGTHTVALQTDTEGVILERETIEVKIER